MTKKVEIKKGEDIVSRMSDIAAKIDDGTGVEIIRRGIQEDGSHTNLTVFTSKNDDLKLENKLDLKVEVSSVEQENDSLLHFLL